jgi:pilus assembly protein CpaB
MVETEKMPVGLVEGSISNVSCVLGRYANTNLYAGDYLTAEKLSASLKETDTMAAGTSKGKLVVSVTLPSLASGVSGRLLPGDIVTVMSIPTSTKNQTLGLDPNTADIDTSSGAVIYPELKYLEVCMVTASDGSDADVSTNPTDEEKNTLPVTVSFYADEEQAALLAELEQQGTIYLAFVARGEAADAYIPDTTEVK